jgi:hypothetical protein
LIALFSTAAESRLFAAGPVISPALGFIEIAEFGKPAFPRITLELGLK